jgi:DnaK suppressor protein
MDKRSIQRFQQLLTQRRDEIQARVNAAKAHIRDQHHHQAKDEGDRATASVTAEMTVAQQAQAEHTLGAIRAALLRIEQGTFGECVQCGEEIGIKRLEAIPWTRYCIVCQELLDSR